MDLKAIKTTALESAHAAKNAVVTQGFQYANWAGRQLSVIGGVLKKTANAVMNWVKGFFKNLPQYFAVAKQYFNTAINYIRNHQYPVAVGAGIAALATLVIFGLVKYAGGE